MNVQHLCRTCLTPSENMYSLFDDEENGGVPSFVVHLLEKFIDSPILPTDNASHNICRECLTKLRETHSFMQKSKRSATTFHQLCSSLVRVKRLKDTSDPVEYVIVVDIEDLKLALENEIEKAQGSFCEVDDCAVEPVENTVESDEEVSSGEEEIGDEFYECPACLDAFGMISVLRTHLIEVHTSENSCIICNNARFSNIWKHTKNHIPKNHACNACGVQFTREHELQEHLQTHIDLPQPTNCEPHLTPLAFKLQSSKRRTVRPRITHTCHMCSKQFSSKSNLARHVKNHCHANIYNEMLHSPLLSQQSYGSHILSQFNVTNNSANFPAVDENIVVMNEALNDDRTLDEYTNLLQESDVTRTYSSNSNYHIEEIEL